MADSNSEAMRPGTENMKNRKKEKLIKLFVISHQNQCWHFSLFIDTHEDVVSLK